MIEPKILKRPKKLDELIEFAADCVTHRKCSAGKKRMVITRLEVDFVKS